MLSSFTPFFSRFIMYLYSFSSFIKLLYGYQLFTIDNKRSLKALFSSLIMLFLSIKASNFSSILMTYSLNSFLFYDMLYLSCKSVSVLTSFGISELCIEYPFVGVFSDITKLLRGTLSL